MIDFIALQAHTKQLITKLLESQGGESLKTPRLIVALSGGADSVFLLHLLVQTATTMPLTLIVAHLNHGWRGAADNADQQYCHNLAQQFNYTFITAHADEIVTTKGWNGSQEELGRHQRHTFLQNTAKQFNACGIAFGHHAQDQEETFFIRLMRGASLEGLCGMYENSHSESRSKPFETALPGFLRASGIEEQNNMTKIKDPAHPEELRSSVSKDMSGCKIPIIRPLLHTNRTDIEQWLTTNNQPWCHDSDNTNPRFLRNRIRHELLPVLHAIDRRFEHNFARTVHQLQQEQELIDQLVNNTFAIIFDNNGQGNLDQFKKLHPMLQGHVLKKLLISNKMPFNLSQGFIDEALRFLNSPRGGTHTLGTTWALHKKTISFLLVKIN